MEGVAAQWKEKVLRLERTLLQVTLVLTLTLS